VPGHLLDTNVLLRLTRRGDPIHARIQATVRRLIQEGGALYYCPQNIVELWSVMTRPVDRNGLGLSAAQAEQEV
jgi:predicted nucleic acid-binding protein